MSRRDGKPSHGTPSGDGAYFDAHFWSTYFLTHFAAQAQFFCDTLETRVLPAFEAAGTEADALADEVYERFMAAVRFEDGPAFDTSQAAEAAKDAGVSHYLMIQDARQVFLNLGAAALYHMFEQQLLVFHRRQVLKLHEEHDPSLNADVHVLHERLGHAGVSLETLPSWIIVDELRLAANVVKHGEAASARRLREVRPQLLQPPVRHFESSPPLGLVSQPLAGQDIYVTVADIQRYRDALFAIWNELGDALVQAEHR